jgi:transcriptional regulator with XRE-family HTH domain
MASGQALRLERLRRHLRQHDIASAADCSRSRIAQVEAMRRVPAEWTDRIRRALILAERLKVAQASERAAPEDKHPGTASVEEGTLDAQESTT